MTWSPTSHEPPACGTDTRRGWLNTEHRHVPRSPALRPAVVLGDTLLRALAAEMNCPKCSGSRRRGWGLGLRQVPSLRHTPAKLLKGCVSRSNSRPDVTCVPADSLTRRPRGRWAFSWAQLAPLSSPPAEGGTQFRTRQTSGALYARPSPESRRMRARGWRLLPSTHARVCGDAKAHAGRHTRAHVHTSTPQSHSPQEGPAWRGSGSPVPGSRRGLGQH